MTSEAGARSGFVVDYRVLGIFLFLMGLGTVLFHASGAAAFDSFGALMMKRFAHIGVALIAFGVGAALPYRWYLRLRGLLLIGTILLLALPLLPGMSVQKYGATRWATIFGLSFQPAEIAKVTFVLYLASFVSRKSEEIRRHSKGLVPSIAVSAMVFGLLAMEGDLGTAMILVAVMATLFFLGNARLTHVLLMLLLVSSATAIWILSSPRRQERIACAMRWDSCSEDANWQTRNAQWAFGSGGATGVGLGRGLQTNQGYLLKAQSDFVYALVAEQMGFLGSLAVLVAYLALLLIAVTIARDAPDRFGGMVAMGLGVMIALHALVHMGVTMRVPFVPAKGLCLPLVSAGGTALAAQAWAVGVLLNVSMAGRAALMDRPTRGSAWGRVGGEVQA